MPSRATPPRAIKDGSGTGARREKMKVSAVPLAVHKSAPSSMSFAEARNSNSVRSGIKKVSREGSVVRIVGAPASGSILCRSEKKRAELLNPKISTESVKGVSRNESDVLVLDPALAMRLPIVPPLSTAESEMKLLAGPNTDGEAAPDNSMEPEKLTRTSDSSSTKWTMMTAIVG